VVIRVCDRDRRVSPRRIGCTETAKIKQKAINTLGILDLTAESIETSTATEGGQRQRNLHLCDDAYYKSAEPIAERLFAFIKTNEAIIRALAVAKIAPHQLPAPRF
jgi:hypothetical protein